MKFHAEKAQAKSQEYLEFRRLDSFFTSPGSRVHVPARDVEDAHRRYEQLHNLFFAR